MGWLSLQVGHKLDPVFNPGQAESPEDRLGLGLTCGGGRWGPSTFFFLLSQLKSLGIIYKITVRL